MQVERPDEGTYLMPITWYFAPAGAKEYRGINAFGSGVWDRDGPQATPSMGEQPPYNFPWYDGENVWGYTGQCVVGTPDQFANGLSEMDLVVTRPSPPDCCKWKPNVLSFGPRVDFHIFEPGRRVEFTTPGPGMWMVPPGVKSIVVECWGAATPGFAGPLPNALPGGGGGAYARSTLSVNSGSVFPFFVGDGSVGVWPLNGDTSFGIGPLVLGVGGGRPPFTISTPGRAAACIGTVRFDGGWGGGAGGIAVGGGGGSSASPFSPGNYPSFMLHNPGGTDGLDSGAGGNGQFGVIPSTPGANPGGGGGGCTVAFLPVPGGNGRVRIWY